MAKRDKLSNERTDREHPLVGLCRMAVKTSALTVPEIAAQTGVPHEWLYAFSQGRIGQPPANRVLHLLEFFCGSRKRSETIWNPLYTTFAESVGAQRNASPLSFWSDK